MMNFAAKDSRFGLSIPDDLLKTLNPLLKKAVCKETGGILVGHYDNQLKNAFLFSFSPPPKDSKAGYFWFKRGNKGLYNLLKEEWGKGRYYIGEWHFHPKAEPEPSEQDCSQMRKIALDQDYKCPEPIMIIVGGTYESFKVRAFVFAGSPAECIELHEIPPLFVECEHF